MSKSQPGKPRGGTIESRNQIKTSGNGITPTAEMVRAEAERRNATMKALVDQVLDAQLPAIAKDWLKDGVGFKVEIGRLDTLGLDRGTGKSLELEHRPTSLTHKSAVTVFRFKLLYLKGFTEMTGRYDDNGNASLSFDIQERGSWNRFESKGEDSRWRYRNPSDFDSQILAAVTELQRVGILAPVQNPGGASYPMDSRGNPPWTPKIS